MKSCTDGTSRISEGTDCPVYCGRGYYGKGGMVICRFGLLDVSIDCTECPAGEYQDEENQIDISSCKECPIGTVSSVGSSTCRGCWEERVWYTGSNIQTDCASISITFPKDFFDDFGELGDCFERMHTESDCSETCENNPECVAWSYYHPSGSCFIKDSLPNKSTEDRTTSGVR
eukprot:UN28234